MYVIPNVHIYCLARKWRKWTAELRPMKEVLLSCFDWVSRTWWWKIPMSVDSCGRISLWWNDAYCYCLLSCEIESLDFTGTKNKNCWFRQTSFVFARRSDRNKHFTFANQVTVRLSHFIFYFSSRGSNEIFTWWYVCVSCIHEIYERKHIKAHKLENVMFKYSIQYTRVYSNVINHNYNRIYFSNTDHSKII